MESVNLRNLEQIQETDARKRSSRFGALLLASIAGAALVAAAVVLGRAGVKPGPAADDPLDALVAGAADAPVAPPERLEQSDVTFPEILSDQQSPTTALAAVKDEKGRLVKAIPTSGSLPAGASSVPPLGADRLPVVPLPAGSLLSATAVTTEPKDELTAMAATASKLDPAAEPAPPGMDGGYQIQVASFKQLPDADAFVDDLRKRGHRAFRQAAYVPGRGLWHRVRIGPFKTRFQAIQYKKKLERSERMNAFVVDPHKVKRAQETREAKLAARRKKFGRE